MDDAYAAVLLILALLITAGLIQGHFSRKDPS